jgi:3-oxoacyl-[acyl-carrier-protein] synthase II
MRRVVVTGMGLVTPLGLGVERVWKKLLNGESGVGAIQSFDVSDLPARIAAQVPLGDSESGLFNADDWVPPKDQRRMDQFIVFAMAAATMAVEDAGWKPEDEESRERTGCHDRLRHRRFARHHRGRDHAAGSGPRRLTARSLSRRT